MFRNAYVVTLVLIYSYLTDLANCCAPRRNESEYFSARAFQNDSSPLWVLGDTSWFFSLTKTDHKASNKNLPWISILFSILNGQKVPHLINFKLQKTSSNKQDFFVISIDVFGWREKITAHFPLSAPKKLGAPQCGNFWFFLLIRFYVKSKLANLEPQKLPFWHIKRIWMFIIIDFCYLQKLKLTKNEN